MSLGHDSVDLLLIKNLRKIGCRSLATPRLEPNEYHKRKGDEYL